MSEIDGLVADLRWLRKSMEEHDRVVTEIFERLRQIEVQVSRIEAKQKPPLNSWTIFGIISTVIATSLIVLDRIYITR